MSAYHTSGCTVLACDTSGCREEYTRPHHGQPHEPSLVRWLASLREDWLTADTDDPHATDHCVLHHSRPEVPVAPEPETEEVGHA